MVWRFIDLFQDPTPNGLINLRHVQTMMRLAELTNMKPNEKDDLINLVLLVGKKLVATWKHYRDYFTLEDQLIEQAKAGEVIDTQSVQQISYSQDLYL
jgi:hypothetical protein